MKRYLQFYIPALVVLLFALASCEKDFLDRKPDDQLDESQVFTNYDRVNALLANVYGDLHSRARGFAYLEHFSLSAATDEAEGSTVEGGLSNRFNRGDWGPSSGIPAGGYTWGDLYQSIRKTNVILEGVKKYNTPDNAINPGDLSIRIGETYFMRAYFHFLAARLYGEIVIMDRTADITSDLQFERSSFHKVAAQIVMDCDSAISRLPVKQRDNEFGRVEKGTAMALKAMILWMAATPLWNGGNLPNDTRIGKSEYGYNAERWKLAADAAKAVLDLKTTEGAPRYSLYKGYGKNDFVEGSNNKVYKRLEQMFHDMNAFYNEAILINSRDKWEAWQGDNYPPSYGGGSRQQPVQEQVDEYEFIAPDGYGYPVYDPNAAALGYNDKNPYESVPRDPRFYRDVIYHGAYFQGEEINTAEGEDRISATNATTTGYYHRKFYREEWKPGGAGFQMHFPLIRLPEIMLIYCEAMNEYAGPSGELFSILNELRDRSFMAPVPSGITQDKLREYIHRERRVELYYENNRFFTARLYLEPNAPTELAKESRWQAAGDGDARAKIWPYPRTQRAIHGMRPIKQSDGTYTMERFFVEDRVFNAPTHYLFPLLNSELNKAPSLGQNPGW